jgi:hypothetical protein
MLLLPDGRLVPMRCGCSNLCAYCAWLAAVENSFVVGLDAQWSQPQVGMTLTTHRADFDMDRFRQAVFNVFRWLRRDLGFEGLEYLGLIEWTTGAGGKGRMPHQHVLVKCDQWKALLGQLVDDPRQASGQRYEREIELRERWEAWTGGAWVVDMRPLRTPGGAIAYTVGHHHKREQAPPRKIGRMQSDGTWAYEPIKGTKRFRPSKGYFDRTRAEKIGDGRSAIQVLRSDAKRMMREDTAKKRLMAQLIDRDVPGEVMNEVLHELVRDALDAPPAIPVAALEDGRLRDMRTGEVYDGPADAIYKRASRA